MTVHYKTEGFVFKKEERLEADRIFSVFTKDFGRVEIVGKSIRKINAKLRGNIEVFSLSEIEFIQGKSQKTLTDVILIQKFSSLIDNPEKLLLAIKISKVIDDFVKGQEEDEKIWDLIIDAFKKLNNCAPQNISYLLIYYYFIWNFIFILGYGPELYICAVCSQKLNPHSLYFSYKEGGVTCTSCSLVQKDCIKITSDIVKVIRLTLKKDWETLSKIKMEIGSQILLKEVSEKYYLYLKSNFVTDTIKI